MGWVGRYAERGQGQGCRSRGLAVAELSTGQCLRFWTHRERIYTLLAEGKMKLPGRQLGEKEVRREACFRAKRMSLIWMF